MHLNQLSPPPFHRAKRRHAVLGGVLVVALLLAACVREATQTADVRQENSTAAAPPSAPGTVPPTVAPAVPKPKRPAGVDLARLRATAPPAPVPWPWGVDPSPDRGHRVCADAAPPPRWTRATFARTDGSASLTPDIVSVICAAAPKSGLRVAIYYIENNGEDVQRILDALSFVAKRRGVSIRIVQDKRRRDESYEFKVTADQLRTFAAVHNCLDGCRSELPPRGEQGGSPQVEVQHHKFIVLSDTYASRGVSPIVWTASANWSDPQLHDRNQSGLILRDAGLAEAFALRFDSMLTCATRGCRAWNRWLRRGGLAGSDYGVVRHGGVWFDRDERFWPGSPDSGTWAQFSPWQRGDPVVGQLSVIKCTERRNTVWVAQRVIARSRYAVTSALAALDDAGCDVRIIVSWNSMRAVRTFADGYFHLLDLGLDVSCVEGVHDKFLLINAVDTRTGKGFKSITAGSQGMMRRALRYSDEALVTLTTAGIPRRQRAINKAVWSAYADHYADLANHTRPCPV